jgi:hypothetical protein
MACATTSAISQYSPRSAFGSLHSPRRRFFRRLSPFPFAGLLVVACHTALDHFVAKPIACRNERGEVAPAEAKRAERHHNRNLQQQFAHVTSLPGTVWPRTGVSGDGVSGATGTTGCATRSAQPIEPTGVPNIPALTSRQGFRNSSGNLAMLAAIRWPRSI